MIRKIAGFLLALTAAVFAQWHSLLQVNIFQYGHKLDMNHLPVLTAFLGRYHYAGYVLPLIAFAVIFLRFGDEDKQKTFDELAFWTVCIVSLIWGLTCAISWQLPLYYPVAVIK